MKRDRSNSAGDRESGSKQGSPRESRDDSTGEDGATRAIESLHDTVGNSALQRLLRSGAVQAKMEVSQPGDPSEREAERVAEQVMRMSDPESQVSSGAPEVNRKSPSGGGTVESEAEEQIESVKGRGKRLSPSTRSYFEPRFGRDFGDVRVHTDQQADEAARSINAEAFTHGKDIAFRSGAYDPDSTQGKKLMAHELTHIVQSGNTERSVHRQPESGEGREDSGGAGKKVEGKKGAGTVSIAIGEEKLEIDVNDPAVGKVNRAYELINQQLEKVLTTLKGCLSTLKSLDNLTKELAKAVQININPAKAKTLLREFESGAADLGKRWNSFPPSVIATGSYLPPDKDKALMNAAEKAIEKSNKQSDQNTNPLTKGYEKLPINKKLNKNLDVSGDVSEKIEELKKKSGIVMTNFANSVEPRFTEGGPGGGEIDVSFDIGQKLRKNPTKSHENSPAGLYYFVKDEIKSRQSLLDATSEVLQLAKQKPITKYGPIGAATRFNRIIYKFKSNEWLYLCQLSIGETRENENVGSEVLNRFKNEMKNPNEAKKGEKSRWEQQAEEAKLEGTSTKQIGKNLGQVRSGAKMTEVLADLVDKTLNEGESLELGVDFELKIPTGTEWGKITLNLVLNGLIERWSSHESGSYKVELGVEMGAGLKVEADVPGTDIEAEAETAIAATGRVMSLGNDPHSALDNWRLALHEAIAVVSESWADWIAGDNAEKIAKRMEQGEWADYSAGLKGEYEQEADAAAGGTSGSVEGGFRSGTRIRGERGDETERVQYTEFYFNPSGSVSIFGEDIDVSINFAYKWRGANKPDIIKIEPDASFDLPLPDGLTGKKAEEMCYSVLQVLEGLINDSVDKVNKQAGNKPEAGNEEDKVQAPKMSFGESVEPRVQPSLLKMAGGEAEFGIEGSFWFTLPQAGKGNEIKRAYIKFYLNSSLGGTFSGQGGTEGEEMDNQAAELDLDVSVGETIIKIDLVNHVNFLK